MFCCFFKPVRVLRKEKTFSSFNPEKEDVWYTNLVVGREKVSQTYRELGEILGNDDLKKVTGHGGRACLVTYSLLHGVTSAAIMAQTGHANVGSMQPYARLSVESEKFMQDVLAGYHGRNAKKIRRKRGKGGALKPSRFDDDSSEESYSSSSEDIRLSKRRRRERKGRERPEPVKSSQEIITVDDSSEDAVRMKCEDGNKRMEELEKSMKEPKACVDEQQKERSELIMKLDQVLCGNDDARNRGNAPQALSQVSVLPAGPFMPANNVPFSVNPMDPARNHGGVLAPQGFSFAGPLQHTNAGTFTPNSPSFGGNGADNTAPPNQQEADTSNNSGNDRNGGIQFRLFCAVM